MIIISASAAVYVKTRVKGVREGGHGFIWRLGATLRRLLPVIEINNEFAAFFDDPKRERLTAWQSGVFSLIAIIGWVPGAAVAAAVSGLTQSPDAGGCEELSLLQLIPTALRLDLCPLA